GTTYSHDLAGRYREGGTWKTALGNPRIDLVGFGYFHPLMAFVEYPDIRRQLSLHRKKIESKFGYPGSKGLFPPENAFSERMIPALVDEGFQWVLVDSMHLDRANSGFPYSDREKMIPPNQSDIRNDSQFSYVNQSCQQNTENAASVPFSFQPHWVQ
ncbi:MAG: hypothetical protein PHW04_11460, partial [Candidatus Wallbacteria bacterium]|nr:hypothetical protein [Candidatus Wallbacteria bacterium]